jgi:hypothetical protein
MGLSEGSDIFAVLEYILSEQSKGLLRVIEVTRDVADILVRIQLFLIMTITDCCFYSGCCAACPPFLPTPFIAARYHHFGLE